ncbi:MAG: ATP-binding protein, partial [Eggerthellaceae bacterium]|nr:ATP-binding protein [Eggerthellaceae bacterium]
DGLLSFWFTFVLPYEGELEMGNLQPSIRAMDALFDSRFVALAFEDVSRQTVARLCSSGAIPFEPNRIGSYWNKKSTIEIGVCATSGDENRILLGECKFHRERPFAMREYQSLVQKTAESGIASGKEALFCLFSKTGFETGLLNSPERGGTLFLVNENELLP